MDTLVKKGAKLSTDHHIVVSWIHWQGRRLAKPGRPKSSVRVCWECLAEPSAREISNSYIWENVTQIPRDAGDNESECTMLSALIADVAVFSCGHKVSGASCCGRP